MKYFLLISVVRKLLMSFWQCHFFFVPLVDWKEQQKRLQIEAEERAAAEAAIKQEKLASLKPGLFANIRC
jgi:hypothetical protein